MLIFELGCICWNEMAVYFYQKIYYTKIYNKVTIKVSELILTPFMQKNFWKCCLGYLGQCVFSYFPKVVLDHECVPNTFWTSCQIYSKLTIMTLEQCLMLILLTLNIFTLWFYCYYWWIWTIKSHLDLQNSSFRQ